MIKKMKTNKGRNTLFLFSLFKMITAVLLLILISSAPASAQIKIYVETDLEGVSGVYKFAQTREKDSPLNIQACEYFMGILLQ